MTSNRPRFIVKACQTIDLHALERNPSNFKTLKACEAPHSDSDLAHYVLVRRDMPIGDICAQIIHAVGETILEPHPPQTIAVALAVRDTAHLIEYHERLKQAGIDHKLITECDGEPMAIGVVPTRDRARVRKVVSSLPLIK